MYFFKPAPRSKLTTIPCKDCGTCLEAQRNCHEAYLFCSTCNVASSVQDYVSCMDDALEEFLEQLFCDRI